MSQNLQKEINQENNDNDDDNTLQQNSHSILKGKFDFFRTIRQKLQIGFYKNSSRTMETTKSNPAMTNTYEYFYDERIGEDDELTAEDDSKVYTTVLTKNLESQPIRNKQTNSGTTLHQTPNNITYYRAVKDANVAAFQDNNTDNKLQKGD